MSLVALQYDDAILRPPTLVRSGQLAYGGMSLSYGDFSSLGHLVCVRSHGGGGDGGLRLFVSFLNARANDEAALGI